MPVSVVNFGSNSLRVSSSLPVRTCRRNSAFVLAAGAAEVGCAAAAAGFVGSAGLAAGAVVAAGAAAGLVGSAAAAGLAVGAGAGAPPQAARKAPAIAATPPSITVRRVNGPCSRPRMVILPAYAPSATTIAPARDRPRHDRTHQF